MAVTATITKEVLLSSGFWRVRLELTDSVSGIVEPRGPYRWNIPLQADRQAAADAIAADSEGGLAAAELQLLLSWVRQGLNANDFPLVHNTLLASRKFLARDLLNKMRDPAPGGEVDLDRYEHIRAQAQLFDNHGNPYIANTLLAGTWSAGQVGGARQKALALRDLDHGMPEVPEGL